jgi:hypothetical protein
MRTLKIKNQIIMLNAFEQLQGFIETSRKELDTLEVLQTSLSRLRSYDELSGFIKANPLTKFPDQLTVISSQSEYDIFKTDLESNVTEISKKISEWEIDLARFKKNQEAAKNRERGYKDLRRDDSLYGSANTTNNSFEETQTEGGERYGSGEKPIRHEYESEVEYAERLGIWEKQRGERFAGEGGERGGA